MSSHLVLVVLTAGAGEVYSKTGIPFGLILAATKNFIATDFTPSATCEVTTSDEHVMLLGENGDPRNEGVLWRAVDVRAPKPVRRESGRWWGR